jgi:hypothetical protein
MCLKTTGGATLLLHNQLDGVERPLAGPGKVIHGEILLERPETVRSVVLKACTFYPPHLSALRADEHP